MGRTIVAQQDVLDRADFLIVRAVYVDADQFRRPPFVDRLLLDELSGRRSRAFGLGLGRLAGRRREEVIASLKTAAVLEEVGRWGCQKMLRLHRQWLQE